jgi:Xaa-Pro aminopeptidase
MEKRKIDLAVYGSCPNFQYLTGLLIDWRRGVDLMSEADNVLVPRDGNPILTLSEASSSHVESCWIDDARILEKEAGYKGLLGSIISDLDWDNGRVAVGEHLWSSTMLEMARFLSGAKFIGGGDLMDHIRAIKEPAEIEVLRRVAKMTDETMEKVVPTIQEGICMREMRLDIEMIGRRLGASDISFPPSAGFVKSGSEAKGKIFTYKMEEDLQPDTTIFFDVGFVLDGYCSDWGRAVFWGVANKEVQEGYKALQRAVVDTVEKIEPGVTKVNDIFPSIESYLDSDGYGDYLRARLPHGSVGHQIGVEVHEPPWLKPENSDIIQPGMVFCIEPKLWHDGEYYLRVEDMVLIKGDRAEFLTQFDRELFQL